MADPASYPEGSTPERMSQIDTNDDLADLVAEHGILTVASVIAAAS